jgi:hypothetical protein
VTVDVQNRIDRLMGILARECSELDVAQIAGLLTDLALAAEKGGVSDERGRVLEAVQVAGRRISRQSGEGMARGVGPAGTGGGAGGTEAV